MGIHWLSEDDVASSVGAVNFKVLVED